MYKRDSANIRYPSRLLSILYFMIINNFFVCHAIRKEYW